MDRRELAHADLTDVAEALRLRQITSTELTTRMLERIAELDPRYKSYLHVCSEHALSRAALADAEIARGQYRGPLHGVPVGVKDLCNTTFAPTTAGTKVLSGHLPATDATVVARLLDAGAVVLGKLTMTEGAYGSHHPQVPAPLNPWGSDLWVGPSSTGSGVATAAGLCYGAIATDTGGSIRLPSATCGLTGLKPTWGRVSRHGLFPLADSMDHAGPMARSVRDCAAILQVIAGWDPEDPTSLRDPVPDYGSEAVRGVRGLRIGIDRDHAFSGLNHEVAQALERALVAFADLGAEVVYVKLPPSEALVSKWVLMCAVEAAVAHAATYPARRADYGPDLAQLIELGRQAHPDEIALGNELRQEFTGSLSAVLETVDCLLMPTLPFPIPTLAQMAASAGDAAAVDYLLRFTAPFDFSGHPTLTLPSGSDQRGLPLSMQLVAPHLREDTLVRVGHAFQAVTDWHRMAPRALSPVPTLDNGPAPAPPPSAAPASAMAPADQPAGR